MEQQPNIYSAVVFDLHPRVKELIDQLNDSGQIDLDSDGHPWLLAVDRQGANTVVKIVRNGQQESIILNTRRQRDPHLSWNPDDGFERKARRAIPISAAETPDRRERRKRTAEAIERIVDKLIL